MRLRGETAVCILRVSAASLLLAVLLLGTAAHGQSNAHVLPLQFGLPVAGQPFSGVRVLDYEPSADSSDKTAVHAEEKLFRDSAGRTRSETKYPDRLPTVDILDFVTRTHFHWTVGDDVVTAYPMPEPSARTSASVAAGSEALPEDAPRVEGVPTRYSRSVQGSDRVEQLVESWYAPDLHLALLTIIDRKGAGKTTYRLEHLSRSEPDAALFKVPDGYKLQNARQAPPPPPPANAVAEAHPVGSASDGHPTATSAPAYASDPKFQKALQDAKNRRLPIDDQLENWKHASKLAHGQCAECLRRVLSLQLAMGAWKDAVNSAQQLEALSPTERLYAEAQRGSALLRYNSGSPKAEQLAQADAAFRDVLAKAPHSRDIIFEEGRVLAMQGRSDEAKAMFARYVEIVPASDRMRARAERFSEDPHLATLAMAPPFRMVTSDGQELQLDDMNGKVVVLDFWATWCGPCRATLPEVARIAKEYADDPILVLISVSQDSDESAWKAFVQKNNMTWPQYRDANRSLSNTYGVSAIPHFFTIDPNGVLKTEQVGSDADVRSVVSNLVKKAHKAAAQAAIAGDKKG